MGVTLKKLYKNLLEELLLIYGFKYKKGLFYRLVSEEILQTISLHTLNRGRECNLMIGLFPLYIILDDMDQVNEGTFGLGQIVNRLDTWWKCKPSDSKSVERVIKALLFSVQDKVLPLFESTKDCNSCLKIIDEIEKDIYKVPLHSPASLWINAKLRNYERCVRIINYIEYQNMTAVQANKDIFSENDYKKYVQDAENDLFEFRKIRESILNNDYEYIEMLLKRNENISRDTLSSLL